MFESVVVQVGDRLAGIVDGLDPDVVPGPAATELWAAFDRVERLAAAGKTLLARRVADTHIPDRAGVRTAAEDLARRAGSTVGAARDAVDVSARLRELPRVQAAVRRGDLSPAQAAVITSAAGADPTAQRRLLELARTASLPELREGPVPVPVARNLLGESVLKLVITRGVDVAHITHLGRGPSAAQRIALAWTSPGSTVAGCPRTRIDYDHREPWARTRRTRLNQLDPLCEHHHDLKTRHHWALLAGHGKRPIVPPHDPRHPQRQRKLRPG